MWNHNTHYHSYLLQQIPHRICRALDVGCGLGLFARKLSERSKVVDALDVDSAVLSSAAFLNPVPNIFYLRADFLVDPLPADDYDVIVSIAALHHMDIEAALKRAKSLLRPSGKLMILGLYRESAFPDYAYSVVSIPLNFLLLKRHQALVQKTIAVAPIRPAHLSLKQIKKVSEVVIPGYRLQRHLFWRYSLIWQKP